MFGDENEEDESEITPENQENRISEDEVEEEGRDDE